MSKGGSKKGSPFEREVCKTLSLWWTGGEHDDVFYRTSTSGARATTRAKKGKSTRGGCGDVAATDEVGQPFMKAFTLELKRGYNKDTPYDLLDKPDGPCAYREWIRQAEASRKAAGSLWWMIIHKRDRREAMCLTNMPMGVIVLDALLYMNGTILYAVRLARFMESLSPSEISNEVDRRK